jgi:hypothetical protein
VVADSSYQTSGKESGLGMHICCILHSWDRGHANLLNSGVVGGRDLGTREKGLTSPKVMVDLREAEDRPYARTLYPPVDAKWQLNGRENAVNQRR